MGLFVLVTETFGKPQYFTGRHVEGWPELLRNPAAAQRYESKTDAGLARAFLKGHHGLEVQPAPETLA